MTCEFVLPFRDRRGRDTAFEMLGSVQRKAAPTRADLEDVVVRAEFELAADAVVFGCRRHLHRRLHGVENACRIGQRRVQEELEEVVPEVVMGGDVLSASGAGVAAKCMEERECRAGQARQSAVQILESSLVSCEYANHARKVVGLPVSIHVRLGGSECSPRRDRSVEARSLDTDGRVERHVPFAKTFDSKRIFDDDRAAFNRSQLVANATPRQAIDEARLQRQVGAVLDLDQAFHHGRVSNAGVL